MESVELLERLVCSGEGSTSSEAWCSASSGACGGCSTLARNELRVWLLPGIGAGELGLQCRQQKADGAELWSDRSEGRCASEER